MEGNMRELAKQILAQARSTEDMTPKSQAETFNFPPSLVAEADRLHEVEVDTVDMLVEAARFDIERCPDVTGTVYGFFLLKLLREPEVIAGVVGEAIIRLAKMPDYVNDLDATLAEMEKGA